MKTEEQTYNRVVVLLSSYNGEKYIKQQIESIERQQGVHVSVIVRDDGSTDNTVNILRDLQKDYNNIELIIGENVGVISSFVLLAIYAAKVGGDYFAFADQDDVWESDKLEYATNAIDSRDRKPNVYFSNLNMVDSKLRPIRNVYLNKIVLTKKGALARNFAYGCTMVFNEAALKLFVINPNARMWMHDYWLYLIGMFLGHLEYDPIPHIMYRQHDSNTVGLNHDIKKTLEIKKKAICNITKHPREEMAIDFLATYKDLLGEEDKRTIQEFANYRRDFWARIKAAFDKDYLVYEPFTNFFLTIRFIIGNV